MANEASFSADSLTNTVIVFHEPDYPQACPEEIISRLISFPYVSARATELAPKIAEGCGTLVSFHGPYFPKRAWPAILDFLEKGGNLAIFGGMPFNRPVTEKGQIEPEQQAYTRTLHLGPFFPVELDRADITLTPAEALATLDNWSQTLAASQAGSFWTFDPKLSQVSDHVLELGSAGPIDTILTPLIFATARTGENSEVHKIATPALLLDQKEGRFRGGRWLISAWQPASPEIWLEYKETIYQLLQLASEGCISLEVRPALASIQAGEQASLVIKAQTNRELKARLILTGPDDKAKPSQTFEVEFGPSTFSQEKRLDLAIKAEPGLYQVETVYSTSENPALRQITGFWIWDKGLVEQTRGKQLTLGRDYFYQGDQPFLVYGTTYMDSAIQRRFLNLPNPARWDKDFAEMKAAGVNLIRTGLWTAWRQFMPVAGVFDEAALRALDAFVMTACKYDIQLVFNFFAFYPPLFEGKNPWLDPRSLRGQQEFVSAIVQRYAGIDLVSWDLINEPSFGDPAKIFAERPIPNYDEFELKAFRQWLQQRYSLDELQQRWGETPADLASWEAIRLPQTRDFITNVRNNDHRTMSKAADYTLFSQEKFNEWAELMYQTIRAAGSRTLVGVGQDEAGVRIAPQFYAASVDYTTTHPWWNNDALLWDMLSDKTPFQPNLLQETGVMLVTDVNGKPWRTPAENGHVLERKLYTGLAARGAGLVQWLWHTNAYMTSDNENSIGLVRADGSAKPELLVFKEFGQLVQSLEGQLQETAQLPEVWLVMPYTQWTLRPELGVEATQRAVRTLGYDLGVIPQLVGEPQLPELVKSGQQPVLVIVPGLQFFSREAWEALQTLAQKGATVVINGIIRPEGLYALPGLDLTQDKTVPRPVSRYEQILDLNGQAHPLTFEGEKIGYIQKAHNQYQTYNIGKGRVIWNGLPLELSSSTGAIRYLYRQFLGRNSELKHEDSPVLVSSQKLKDGQLVLVVSESAVTEKISLENNIQLEIAPTRAGAAILKDGKISAVFGGVAVAPPEK